jgi:hypothetical protein
VAALRRSTRELALQCAKNNAEGRYGTGAVREVGRGDLEGPGGLVTAGGELRRAWERSSRGETEGKRSWGASPSYQQGERYDGASGGGQKRQIDGDRRSLSGGSGG